MANHPRDAAEIQQRLSDGRGLLADGGVSISNIFTGDAPTALLTMSSVTGGGRHGPSRGYAAFFINPYGLSRSLVLSVGEMLKELLPGPATAAPRRAARGSTGTAPTCSSGPSRTCCCATSTPG